MSEMMKAMIIIAGLNLLWNVFLGFLIAAWGKEIVRQIKGHS